MCFTGTLYAGKRCLNKKCAIVLFIVRSTSVCCPRMAAQLSGVAIVIMIAIGFTTFVLLFIFGKRQIMRFALKSRRGPHFPIASDAPKHLRKEIERRLDVVKDIRSDPILFREDLDDYGDTIPAHVFRMKAVDSFKLLEEDLISGDTSKRKPAGQDLKFYLQKHAREGAALQGLDSRLINAFVDSYIHARHEANPFGKHEYQRHINILDKIRCHIRENIRENSGKERTPGILVQHESCSSINGSSVANTVIRRDHDEGNQVLNRKHSISLETSV